MIYTWGELEADRICQAGRPLVAGHSTVKESAAYVLALADRIKNERAEATMNRDSMALEVSQPGELPT